MNKDLDHLKLLSVFHMIVGGLGFLFSFLPSIHVVLALIFLLKPDKLTAPGASLPPPVFGWIFLIMGLAFIFIGLICSTCILVSGHYIRHRKKYWFSFIVACVECLFFPFGTALGIFTIIVLSRDTVKNLYGIQGSNSIS